MQKLERKDKFLKRDMKHKFQVNPLKMKMASDF